MEFYIGQEGSPAGPFSADQVESAIRDGHVDGETLVWREGMTHWLPVKMVPELAAFVSVSESQRRRSTPLGARPPFVELRNRTNKRVASEPDDEFAIAMAPLPTLGAGQVLDMEAVRDPYETLYFRFVIGANVLVGVLLLALVFAQPLVGLMVIGYGLLLVGLAWISWKLFCARLLGHCIEVSPTQYPLINRVVEQAIEYLEIARPQVYVMQGHGLFEVLVGKFMRDRGVLILTSGLLDEIVKRPTSRELMMYVGRQLGHIRAGHFDARFMKNVIGAMAGPFYLAWRRHCHMTADRIGLLCAGELHAAEQSLLMITVGAAMAEQTDFGAVIRQREKLIGNGWAWLDKVLGSYPQMLVRLVKLREFALGLGLNPGHPTAHTTVGALPIHHTYLRAVPLLLIHGHDRVALLELKSYLLEEYPHVAPKIMAAEHEGTLGMSEKFDRIAGGVIGAIALLTPDDKGGAAAETEAQARARQNVVLEVGWAWGKLGRESFLMLKRGDIEIPSDLRGADVQTFHQSPAECARALQAFIEGLVRRHRLM